MCEGTCWPCKYTHKRKPDTQTAWRLAAGNWKPNFPPPWSFASKNSSWWCHVMDTLSTLLSYQWALLWTGKFRCFISTQFVGMPRHPILYLISWLSASVTPIYTMNTRKKQLKFRYGMVWHKTIPVGISNSEIYPTILSYKTDVGAPINPRPP